MMKTALITGITGQDGAYLASLLISKGYRVVGTLRDLKQEKCRNLALLGVLGKVDIELMTPSDFQSVDQILRNVMPDEIYHLAGQSSVGLSFDQPLETFRSISCSTLHLLEVMRLSGKKMRFFNAGSGECFGDTGDHAAHECTPFRPRSPYAVAKTSAYWLVANYREAYGVHACSGILFNHESPLRDERFVTKKIIAAACRIADGSKEELHLGDLSVHRDWGWAPEYVEAMWLMLQKERADDYVIATGETRSLTEFVEYAFSYLGLDWTEHVRIETALKRPSDIRMSRANPDKAMQDLGWCAQSKMQDVVRMMVGDYRANHNQTEH